MNTAGAHELGYASVAIVGALLDRLVINKVISRSDAAAIFGRCHHYIEGTRQSCKRPRRSPSRWRCERAPGET